MLPIFHNIYKGMRESMMSVSLLHPSLTILQLIKEKGFEMVLEDIIYHVRVPFLILFHFILESF